MIETFFFRSSKASSRVSSSQSQSQSQQSRVSSSVESETSSSTLLKRIRRDDVDEQVINLYVVQMFDMYQFNRIRNHELYDAIMHDFFDLISNHWNMLTSIIWNFVNTICYTQEYWILHSDRKKIRTELMYRLIRELFRQNWTSNQIAYVKKNYRKLFLAIRDRKNELEEIASERERFRSISSIASIESSATLIFTFVFTAFSHSAESLNVQSTWQSNVQRVSQFFTKYFSIIYENRQYAQESTNLSYSKYSFNESSTHRQTYKFQSESRNFCKKLVDLIKIYKGKDKFKNKDDNFDFKIMIFHDKCNVIKLFKHVYMQAASIMLEERVLSHFYSNRMYAMTFNQFCINMKRYFEESKWQRHNLNKWHFMHIRDIITTNSSLSLSDCLHKLCDDMNTLQQDIDLKYHGSNHFRENFIRACRDHSAFVVELHNSSVNSSILVDSLCISIVNWETVNKSTKHTYLQNDVHDHCFTNRQYRRELFNNRDNDQFSSNFRSRDRFSIRALKICFVCDKFACWSTNYIEQERVKSKKRFINRNSAYKERSEFERRFEQFIVDYEDTDINEFIAQYFEELIIDDVS